MKKPIVIVFAIILILIFISSIIFAVLHIQIQLPSSISYSNKSHYLAWNNELNLRQKGNTCGAHATMALMFLYGKGIKDPYEIYNSFKKLSNGYVLPWEITKYLANNGIKARIRIFWLLSDTQKKQWIKREIEHSKPVIMIVGNKKSLHYITIIGYDYEAFSVYDSGIPSDMNGNNPGTNDINVNMLIKKMNAAKFEFINIEAMISEP